MNENEFIEFNPQAKALFDKKNSFSFFDVFFVVVFTTLIGLFAFVTLFSKCEIDGISMMPTLNDKDNILIANYTTKYENNDIVIIKIENETESLVKRIVATEGEIFYFYSSGSYVYLYKKNSDGIFLSVDEPFEMNINYFNTTIFSLYNPLDPSTIYTVPPNSFLFLGDNRNVSKDSRYYSYATYDQIVGKMVYIIKPNSLLENLINFIFPKSKQKDPF